MINTAFVKTLAGRMIVFGVVPTMLVIGVIVAMNAIDNHREMQKSEEQFLAANAYSVAGELSLRNERWNNLATVLALSQVNGMFGMRKASCDFLKDVNIAFPLIIGAYIEYEPNADGQDSTALKGGDVPREAMDAAGRFVPNWIDSSGTAVLRQRTGMESTESYQSLKSDFAKTGRPAAIITEPVERDGEVVITHTMPIAIQGRFVGTVGVDRNLGAVARLAEDIKDKVGADVFILSAGNRFLASTAGAKDAAGADRLIMQELEKSPYSTQAGLWRSSKQRGDLFEGVDPVLGVACFYASCPVSVGGWNVVIRRTEAEIMATANAALMRNVVIGGIGLVVIGGLLWGVARSVSSRVQRAGIQLYSTATEIGATSRMQEASASTFGAASTQIAAAVKEISATGKDLVRTMESVTTNAAETAQLAGAGRAGLQGMESVMHELDRATTSIADKLGAINERSQKITTVITTITKVADQTNILSINAAIEAEKAGEFGSGFLVIAREIRRLADQTASATLDIEQMVQQMQGAVSSGVMEMDRFSDQVRRGVREVSSAGTQLAEIIDRVNQSTESFEQVNESMRAQSQGAQQISEAMTSLSSNAQQTMQSAKEFGRAAADLQSAISILQQAVGTIRE